MGDPNARRGEVLKDRLFSVERGEKLFCAIALGGLVLFCNVFSAHDNDTGWHIRTGEIIWSQHRIPSADPFIDRQIGTPLLGFEWLSDVVFYPAFRFGGRPGVVALKSATALAAYLVVFEATVVSAPVAAACLGLAAAVSQAGFLERPGVFDLLLLAWLYAVFARASVFKRRFLWEIPLAVALWANLHGGAALVGCWIISCESLDKQRGRSSVERAGWWSLPILSFLAFGLNPYGWRLVSHAWSHASFAQRAWVADWQPLRNFLTPEGFLLVSSAVALLLTFRMRPGRSVWLLGLAAAAISAKRHIALFALPAAPALAEAFGPLLPRLRGTSLRCGLLLLLFFVFGAYWWAHIYVPWGRSYGFGSFEDLSGAVDFLDRQGIGGRMFNQYDAGGAIIGLAYPRRRVFINSRFEYGPEIVREAVLWQDHCRELDERYSFDYAILFNRRGDYPCSALDEDDGWRLAYWDDAALVYVSRRSRVDRSAFAGSFSLLRPNDPSFSWMDPLLRSPRTAERLAVELDRALSVAPGSVEPLLMRA